MRFRRSIKILPGVRANISKSGVSYTIGGRGASVNVKPGRATRTTVGVPGSGLSWTSTREQKSLHPRPEPASTSFRTTGMGKQILRACGWIFVLAVVAPAVLGLIVGLVQHLHHVFP